MKFSVAFVVAVAGFVSAQEELTGIDAKFLSVAGYPECSVSKLTTPLSKQLHFLFLIPSPESLPATISPSFLSPQLSLLCVRALLISNPVFAKNRSNAPRKRTQSRFAASTFAASASPTFPPSRMP